MIASIQAGRKFLPLATNERLKGKEVGIFQNRKTRGCGITKSTILTKKIMLNVAGWKYVGRSCPYEDFDKPNKERRYGYMVYTPDGKRILAATTREEIDDFCMRIYKEFYDSHPKERDWLPDPYNRKKVVSKIITVECS